MSYQIYYDRAYIRVDDKFVPLVNSGSNNCYENGLSGRYRCEKGWDVQNWQHEGQFIFTEAEIRAIARVYERCSQESGMMFKSRNRQFGPGEMERWLINGMKNAYTVEEYVSFHNSLYVLDYASADTGSWQKYPFQTTEEMLRILDDLKGSRSLSIKLGNNRCVYRPRISRAPRKKIYASKFSEYFVLKGEHEDRTIYFVRFHRRGGIYFCWTQPHYGSKFFITEKAALQYLKKYDSRLQRYGFIPERIVNEAAVRPK